MIFTDAHDCTRNARAHTRAQHFTDLSRSFPRSLTDDANNTSTLQPTLWKAFMMSYKTLSNFTAVHIYLHTIAGEKKKINKNNLSSPILSPPFPSCTALIHNTTGKLYDTESTQQHFHSSNSTSISGYCTHLRAAEEPLQQFLHSTSMRSPLNSERLQPQSRSQFSAGFQWFMLSTGLASTSQILRSPQQDQPYSPSCRIPTEEPEL